MSFAHLRPLAAVLALAPVTAHAADDDRDPIVVTGRHAPDPIANPPATVVTIDAAKIATTTNAVSIEDALKYAPSLVIRKRSIGDNLAPIATRTSGLGSSARSVILADGALLSAFIGNNNGSASPRWQLVAPEEVARIDVLYGPFSAAYAGNAIGTVVNITTRTPDRLEANVTALLNYQEHEQYTTRLKLPTGQVSASLGDRIGPVSFLLAATHTVSNGQPITYITATGNPAGTTGGIATFNRLGAPIRVLGAGDIDHHVQDTLKARLVFDLGGGVSARVQTALFLDSTRARLDSYLANSAGASAYTAGFNSSLYLRRQRHWSHIAALEGASPRFDWQVIGTVYDQSRDSQASPLAPNLPPAAFAGGAGQVALADGTGWATLDARGALHTGPHVVSAGAHLDRYELRSRTFTTADWIGGVPGAQTAASLGKTRTAALWAQDAVTLAQGVVATLGLRQEWWRAFDGRNATAIASVTQPERTAARLSPKATLVWTPRDELTVKASYGRAWRFPTVGELYQATVVGTVLANPNPLLRPERADSGELSAEWRDARGSIRLSLFDEVITDALIAQTGTTSAAQPGGATVTVTTSFVQNVDRTRARGVELAFERRDLVPGVDLSASLTYADAITSKNTVFSASVGKLLPSVPRWKGNAVLTWRPRPRFAFTAAMRFSSRNFATLDNSDVFADTYQGFDKFFVVDLRATAKLTERLDAAIGIDNVNNDRYFLFHPFPQRSVTASLHWRL